MDTSNYSVREDIRKNIQKNPDYDFLRTNPRLKDNIFLLGLGGSLAYGTSLPKSDIDIRGAFLPEKNDLYLGNIPEQITNEKTDTVLYSFHKLISLLKQCNPNTIEILGLRPEHYLIKSSAADMLIENRKLFLSRRAITSFGGYAKQKLMQLENKTVDISKKAKQAKMLQAVKAVTDQYPDAKIDPHINKKTNEICLNINLQEYPVENLSTILECLKISVETFEKVGRRNSKAIAHGKLNKHAMHLIRLYYTAFDILEKEEIITYREDEHDLLMRIRNGEFTDEKNKMRPEFFDMVKELDERFEYAKKNTSLPPEPDYKNIDRLVCTITNQHIFLKPHPLYGDSNPI